jgi:hypothetical protein
MGYGLGNKQNVQLEKYEDEPKLKGVGCCHT